MSLVAQLLDEIEVLKYDCKVANSVINAQKTRIAELEASQGELESTLKHREKMFSKLAQGWGFASTSGGTIHVSEGSQCLAYGSHEQGFFAVIEPCQAQPATAKAVK